MNHLARFLSFLGLAALISVGSGAQPNSPAGAAVTMVGGAGDIAGGGSGDSQTATVINSLPPDTQVFTLGDNVYEDGTLSQFNTYYEPTWGAFKSRTHPIIGNHDSHQAGAPGYFDYWQAAGVYVGNRGEGWYSYNTGDWHVVALNSECNGTSYDFCDHTAQKNWLIADLAANPRTCTLAMWHRPMVAPSPVHSDDEGHMLDVWQILYDRGVDLVLGGHDHLYARFAAYNRNANGVDPGGIRQFIVATGGRGFYSVSETSKPGLEAWQSSNFGVLKLTLAPTSYSWDFLPVAGSSYTDSGTANCRGQSSADADGDGWTGALESVIGTDPGQPCGNNGWPADLVGNNRLDIADINSFLFPLRPDGTFAKLGHPVPDPDDPTVGRWNLLQPSNGIIDIGDLNALNPTILAPTARPPMFGGQPAFFSGPC
jgi:hypothetical protein